MRAALGLALVIAGCSTATTATQDAASTVDTGGSLDTGSAIDAAHVTGEPQNHRPSALDCSHTRGPGDPITGDPSAACQTDADCTSGQNGRCLVTTVAARLNYCSYDECFADTDCTGAAVCRCREFSNDANVCAAGNCVTDADCGAGGYCSPSRGWDRINFGVLGYYCHASSDECVDDADCNPDGGSGAACVWYPDRSHWACSSTGFFPP